MNFHSGGIPPARTAGVRELKFLLAPDHVAPVLAFIRNITQPDSHGGGAQRDSYKIQSVYLDTRDFDIFYRTPGFHEAKYRVRRYGNESAVWLEEKCKIQGIVTKRRERLASGGGVDSRLPQGWFHERVDSLQLEPKCQIIYERIARVAETAEGNLRLTLDRGIQCRASALWTFEPIEGPGAVAIDRIILEMKYPAALPSLFKSIIAEFRLIETRFSKYKAGIRSCGLARADGSLDDE